MSRFFSGYSVNRIRALEGAELASFWRRAGAWLVDFLFVVLLAVLAGLPAAIENPKVPGQIVVPFEPFHSLIGIAFILAYFGVFTYLASGRTIGKFIFGIRVVSLAGEKLTFFQCLERALGYVASALEAGFGFAQFFFHPNRQAVHDRIAETVVIRPSRSRRSPPGSKISEAGRSHSRQSPIVSGAAGSTADADGYPKRVPAPGGEVIIPDERAQQNYDNYRYAAARRVDDTLYVSGIVVGRCEGEDTDASSFRAQTRRAFERIRAILKAAGTEFAHVTMINSFHVWQGPNFSGTRDEQFAAFEEVMDEFMDPPWPAWTAVGTTGLLSDDGIVEVQMIAQIPRNPRKRT